MKFLRTAFLFILPVYLISCGTSKKAPPPFYLDKTQDTTIKKSTTKPGELRIRKNDQLSIQVMSLSNDPKADLLYNLPTSEGGGATSGFLVDGDGNIEYPRLGTIHAEGMTKKELATEIKKRLTEPVELLRSPTVIIRFLNYKITVLGYVGREGMLDVPGEKINIIQAIGLAGGITEFGRKDKVKVTRETEEEIQIGYVDLSSDSLFHSPYYYLVQNDVITVEPTKAKTRQADQSQVAQRISMALGIITSAAFIYNIFK
jgi:polysaccharide export outer membrane protein